MRRVPAGQGVSYGYDHRTDRETTLALVPLGYADGVPRQASGAGPVTIGGARFTVAGRIAMDQFVVDVGDHPVAVGDEAVLFGDPTLGAPRGGRLGGCRRHHQLRDRHAHRAAGAAPAGVGMSGLDPLLGHTRSPRPTGMEALGEIGGMLRPGDLVVLTGPLGAGKTTLTRGIAEGSACAGRCRARRS